MKINSLWISQYKNVKDINLQFNSDLVSMLVGRNGLGKSNLIEILVLVFRDLDLLEKKSDFESWAYNPDYFEYKIQYEVKKSELLIELKEGSFTVKTRSNTKSEDQIPFLEISFSEFKKHRREEFLPKFILGYYSGENKRIRELIRSHESRQKDLLKMWHKKGGESKEDGFRRLFFTENFHSQILLLTLVLYRSHESFGPKIEELLNNYLNIEDIVDFGIIFNNPDWPYQKIDGVNKGAEYVLSNINSKDEVKYPFWNVKGKTDSLLTRLYNHQIDFGSEPYSYPKEKNDDERNYVNEYLAFNDIKLEKFLHELVDYFPHPIDFFNALESTEIIGILTSIDLKVKKTNIAKPIHFNQLSEGEQQLLTVLGLILVTGKDDCLFLLDEPDTHLNPDWQRDYVELLYKFNLNDENSHIIVATHSPIIVQSSAKSDVVLFREEENKIVAEVSEIEYETWRLDHVLTSKYFGLDSARPKNEKIDYYMKLRESILQKDEITEDDKLILKEFQNDIGSFPTGETYDDLEAMQFVRIMAKEKKDDSIE